MRGHSLKENTHKRPESPKQRPLLLSTETQQKQANKEIRKRADANERNIMKCTVFPRHFLQHLQEWSKPLPLDPVKLHSLKKNLQTCYHRNNLESGILTTDFMKESYMHLA